MSMNVHGKCRRHNPRSEGLTPKKTQEKEAPATVSRQGGATIPLRGMRPGLAPGEGLEKETVATPESGIAVRIKTVLNQMPINFRQSR